MINLEFTEEEKNSLYYERFHHPPSPGSTEDGSSLVKESKDTAPKNLWFFVTWYGSIGGHKSTKSLSGKRLH